MSKIEHLKSTGNSLPFIRFSNLSGNWKLRGRKGEIEYITDNEEKISMSEVYWLLIAEYKQRFKEDILTDLNQLPRPDYCPKCKIKTMFSLRGDTYISSCCGFKAPAYKE